MKPSSPPPLPIELALPAIEPASAWSTFLEYPPVKALVPALVIVAIAPAVWWFFKDTWKQLDDERREYLLAHPERDYRPYVCLVLVALTLTVQEYYGGRSFFDSTLAAPLAEWEAAGEKWIQLAKFRDLYGFGWWVTARVLGYVIVPLIAWKALFPRDSVLDMGLRGRGFFGHLGLYALCLTAVFGAMALVARQPDFLAYYPFYKAASRSWFDFWVWEGMYALQFLALEFYFRGFMLEVMRRSLGASAIFAMAAPYCMIHYGKPYLEAQGAIIAGVVLGSLSMRTRSIYAGFLVHVSVALSMDVIGLLSRDAMPKVFWP